MKKFKKVFAFLMMLPVAFGFSACKDKEDSDTTTTPSVPEQTTPSQPSTPVVEGFTVSYDYDLPADYKFLMSNPYSVTKEPGETVICPEVSNSTLEPYFLGWFNGNDEVTAVSGQLGDEFALKGKWNVESLKKYYYSTGIQFTTSTENGNTAVISGYTGNSASVIIPEYYNFESVEYKVEAIANSAFADSIVEKLVNNATNYSIGNEAFKNTDLISFDFSEVTSIGSRAFENCDVLHEVSLPTKLLTLGSKVFEGCSSIKNFSTARLYDNTSISNDRFVDYVGNINQNVENLTFTGAVIDNVPDYYFESWTALKNVQFNDTIEELGEYCFVECSNVETIGAIEKLNPETFLKNSISDTKYYQTATTPLIIQNVVVYAPVNTAKNIVLNDVVKIQANAFAGNTTMESIVIPSTVAVIGDKAFYGCTSLKTVDFAENANLITIGSQTFDGCLNLTSVNLQNLTALTTISNYAFAGVSVSNFVIPNTVETIGVGVFKNAAISSFEIGGEADKFIVSEGVLYGVNNGTKTLVAYPKMKAGAAFVMPSDVTNIAPFAFAYSENLIYVKFTQAVITWDYYMGGFNRPYYETFTGTKNTIVMLADSSTIMSPFSNKIHYLIADSRYYSCVFAGDLISIEIASDFEMITGIYTYYIFTEERYFIFTIDSEKEVVSALEITYALV